MKCGLIVLGVLCHVMTFGQLLTWTPSFPKASDDITVTVDATKGNQGLKDFSGNVYVHIGVITSNSKTSTDWKYAPFTWGASEAASKSISLGNNQYAYTIKNIRSFFGVPSNEKIIRIAILFRQGGCNNCAVQRNSDGSDMYIPVYDESLSVRFDLPPLQPFYNLTPELIKLNISDVLPVKLVSSKPSNLQILVNGVVQESIFNKDNVSTTLTFTSSGNYTVTGIANDGVSSIRDSFSFVISGNVVTRPLPPNVKPGINREPGDTALTLVLIAPGKSKISLIGDFPNSDWIDRLQYQMNLAPDNKSWWIRIQGLQPNIEYSYQYFIDGILKIADPYSEKILDPSNDAFISANTYPGLKPYPVGQTSGIVSVVKTNSDHYIWKNTFKRPESRNLVIYECLLRDFVANHDFKTLIDTLPYFNRLGINAIELMPINEFEGNLSWGYNPDFYFAVDKYYGSNIQLKEFIDSCHGRGIAVILDMVLNHATNSCPLAALYWDGNNQRPSADNPWFNPVARHPFNVFNDLNHESPDTKYFATRVMEYWLKQFNMDGYRFDLSKGFTQKNTGSDAAAFGAYDASRVAIWKQYFDSCQKYSPGSYVILEHFADNSEEKDLSDYGMMLWGNANFNYNEATMGYIGTSNFEASLSSQRGWSKPSLVSYMESHDEERLMYKNKQFGNNNSNYNTKDAKTALDRMKLATSFFIMSPGPKLIWQFGELGYDYSINQCTGGNINNSCRLDNKPIRWDYLRDTARQSLYLWYSKLLKLRNTKEWQLASNANTYSLAGSVKWLSYTANDNLNVYVVGNFDIIPITTTLSLPKAGIWYDLATGKSINLVQQTYSNVLLQPGEYHVYTDQSFDVLTPTDVYRIYSFNPAIYPNPSNGKASLQFSSNKSSHFYLEITDINGRSLVRYNRPVVQGMNVLDLPEMQNGVFFVKTILDQQQCVLKYIVH